MQGIWSCIVIAPWEQSSEPISLLLNRRPNFTAPGYSSFLLPHHRTSRSQKHGVKNGKDGRICCPTVPLHLQGVEILSGEMNRWDRSCPSSRHDTGQQFSLLLPKAHVGEQTTSKCFYLHPPAGRIWHPHVSGHGSQSFQFLKVKLLYAAPYPQGDEGLHFVTADSGNTYGDSKWDISSLRSPSHDLLFSWEGIFQDTTWTHIVK